MARAMRLAAFAEVGAWSGRLPAAQSCDGGSAPRDRLPGGGLCWGSDAAGYLDRRIRSAAEDEASLPVDQDHRQGDAAAGKDHFRLYRNDQRQAEEDAAGVS